MLLSPPVNCTKPVMSAVVDDAGVVAGEERTAGDRAIGQGADAAVIGQGRGAAGRIQDNASGRQTEPAHAGTIKISLPAAHHRSAWRDIDRHVSVRRRVDCGAELSLGGHVGRCDLHRPAQAGNDAVCAITIRRNWPRGINVDAATAGLRKDADAIAALGRNAWAGVGYRDWRTRTAVIGSNTDRSGPAAGLAISRVRHSR